MATLIDIFEQYAAHSERLLARAAGTPAERLTPVRRAALARFGELGLPTTRHEDWRYTSVARLAKTAYRPTDAGAAAVQPADLAAFRLGVADETLLVFVNGRYAEHLSQTDGAAGVRVLNLAAALEECPAIIAGHWARHADFQQNVFAALNTALAEDVAVVWAPAGSVVEKPIHILHVCESDRRFAVVQPRTLIVADEGSQLRVVEQYVGLNGEEGFTNAVTEVVAGCNVVAEYTKVVREPATACHIGLLHLHQERDSRIAAHVVSLGGSLIRNDLHVRLAGEGGDCALNGLYLLGGEQHVDNHLRVEHASPHCSSREVFRGILDGHARGVFTGRIVVQPGAQKTDAKQTNKNLLLSGDAQADSKPQLEIYADDVKCTHGATIGQVDDDAVFYLRSRGIDEAAARSLLVYAFAQEGLNEIQVEPLRRQLTALVLERLPNGDLLRDE